MAKIKSFNAELMCKNNLNVCVDFSTELQNNVSGLPFKAAFPA
jgi:hypothetical protein